MISKESYLHPGKNQYAYKILEDLSAVDVKTWNIKDMMRTHKCKIFHGSVTLGQLSIDQCDGCGEVDGRHMKLFAQDESWDREGGSMFKDDHWILGFYKVTDRGLGVLHYKEFIHCSKKFPLLYFLLFTTKAAQHSGIWYQNIKMAKFQGVCIVSLG